MGMFDKDKEIGLTLTSVFGMGEMLVLWNGRIVREDFPGDFGPVPEAKLTVSKLDNPTETFEVSVINSAITAGVREIDPQELPAVVVLKSVETKRGGQRATVLNFVKDYTGPRPSQVRRQTIVVEPAPDTEPAPQPAGSDDIPF